MFLAPALIAPVVLQALQERARLMAARQLHGSCTVQIHAPEGKGWGWPTANPQLVDGVCFLAPLSSCWISVNPRFK